MAASPRLLLAVSVSSLVACASSPPGSPPGADARTSFVRTAPMLPGYTNVYPFSAGLEFRTQSLYTPMDVKGAGRITAIRLQRAADNATAITCPKVTVAMGHSSLAALGTAFASNVDVTSLTTVAVGTVSIPAGTSGSWFEIPLDTPYEYDGAANLVVDLETPASCNGTATVGTLSATGRRLLVTATDTDPAVIEHGATGTVDATPLALQLVFAGAGEDRFLTATATQLAGGGWNYFPFYSGGPRRVQTRHDAADIGGGAGPVAAVGFEVQSLSTTGVGTYTYSMRIGHTTKAALDADFDSNSSDWVTVATSVTIQVNGGIPNPTWVWLPTPDGTFVYNGRDSVVIDVIQYAGDADLKINVETRSGQRSYALSATATTGLVDGYAYHAAFRYAGAPLYYARTGLSGTWLVVGDAASQLQQLVPRWRLGGRGNLTHLAVRLQSTPAGAFTFPLKLHVGETAKSTLVPTDTYASSMDGPVLAFDGTVSVPATAAKGDWIDVALQRPYPYDSRKNLVVLFMKDPSSPSSGSNAYFIAGADMPTAVYTSGNVTPITGSPGSAWGTVGVQLRLGFE